MLSLVLVVTGLAGGAAKKKSVSSAFLDPRSGAALNRDTANKTPTPTPMTRVPFRIVQNAINDPATDTTAQDTQSETSIAANGSKVVIAFNDSGSNVGVNPNHFTGYAYSSTGGLGWTDAGKLPDSAPGDAGDPQLAVDTGTGAFYLGTLPFTTFNTINVFKSTDGGQTFGAPVDGTPGAASTDEQDKEWLAVDNFVGTGRHNVYLCWTRFGAAEEIRLTRSTDQGVSFGPSGGLLINSGGQGCNVVVGPNHAVYVSYYQGTGPNGQGGDNKLFVRKSIDRGVTFGAAVQVADLGTTSVNGDLGLLGGFRSNSFPQVVVNPVSGHLVAVWNDDPTPTVKTDDNGDIFYSRSTTGGASWTAPVRVNDVLVRDQFFPTVSISPDGTRILFSYYSRDHDSANLMFHRQARLGSMNTSTGAIVLNRSFQLGPDTPIAIAQDPVIITTYMGDYDQAASIAGAFYLSWSDNRSGNSFHARQPDVRFARIAVPEATSDVGVSMTLSPASIGLGENTVATINVTASGGPATDVYLNVSPPVGLAVQSANSASGHCDSIGQTINCSLGTIGAGSSKAVQVVATGAYTAATRTLRASATTSSKDTNGVNNSVTGSVVVASGSAVTATRSAGTLGVPIPDLGTTTVSIVNPTEGTVVRATPFIRLAHTYDSDLRISLISPTGKTAVLSNRRGGAGADFGTGANDCTGTKTSFDDLAATPIAAGAPPFTGTFKPDEALATMVGEPNDGVWKLRIQDVAGGDSGTLGCFWLRTTYVP